MAEAVLEYAPLVRHWPKFDTAITVFRYALVREMCRGKRVLEIGAAAGEGTALMADVAAEVVALDRQDLWNGSPAAGLPNVRFVRGDALDLPPEWAGRFDVVVALELIEHLPDPDAFQRAVHRVLADGGIFIFSTPNFDLYSLAGDDCRTPVFQHHLREYRFGEVEQAVLDIWDRRAVSCISQLTFPKSADGDGPYQFLHDTALYTVALGKHYPEYDVRRTGGLAAPMDPSAAQSFLVTLGRGTARLEAAVSFAMDAAAAREMSPGEAAFRSCHVILQRKNENCRWLQQCVSHRDAIIADQQQRIAVQQERIAGLEQHSENVQRRAGNLARALQQRDAELAATRQALGEPRHRIENMLRWLPRWLVARIAKAPPIACSAPAPLQEKELEQGGLKP